MITAVCSLGGSPGATSLATALAACWPSTPLTVPVLVEADASGGDVAVWHRVPLERGLVSLSAASRGHTPPEPGEEREGAEHPVLGHAVELPGGLRAVLAPSDPLEAGRAVRLLAAHPEVLHGGRATVVDVGRAVPGSPGASLLRGADAVVVLVSGSEAAQLRRLHECVPALASLREWGTRVGVAVAGRCPYSDTELEEAAGGLGVWARIPHDELGAALVRGEDVRLRWWWTRLRAHWHRRREPDSPAWTPLLSAARDLADLLDDLHGVGGTSGRGAVKAGAA